jgi:hypothetical protein
MRARLPAHSLLPIINPPPCFPSHSCKSEFEIQKKKKKKKTLVFEQKQKPSSDHFQKLRTGGRGRKWVWVLFKHFFVQIFFCFQQLNIFWHFPIFRTSACLPVCCLSLESHWSFFTLIIIRVYVGNFVSNFWNYLTGDNCHLWIKQH